MSDISKEPDLVAAMRSGRSMKVSGVSTRGNQTSYTYLLYGVTAALKEISNCK